MRADMSAHQKVTASHLQREAYLYVRLSTLRQVFENTESSKRQYALRETCGGPRLVWKIESSSSTATSASPVRRVTAKDSRNW